jgi:hypothetical protein
MNALIQTTKQTLAELNDVLSLMTEAQFCCPLIIFSGSSVGMHARHVVEFYQCLLYQIADAPTINYDKRQRDLRLQSQPVYFARAIEEIHNRLDGFDDAALNTPLSIESDSVGNDLIISSLGRELQYNLEHTIHHSALIKIGILTLLPQADIPPTFGVAPSTIRFQQQIAAT